MAFNLDKIKGLFVISEEEQHNAKKRLEEKQTNEEPDLEKVFGKKVGKDAEKASKTPKNPKTWENTEQPTNDNKNGEFNPKIFDSLTASIQNANLPGEDYLEFVAALQAMEKLPLEETVKIQTVLATLSPRGLTLQTVFESADYYLKVLENERTNFYEALKHQTKEKIGGRDSILSKLEQTIKDKTEKITALQKEIDIATTEIENIKGEIIENQAKIKKTENDFLITYDAVTNQIVSNVEKIKQLDTHTNKQ